MKTEETMNKKLLTALCLASALAGATFVWAQSKETIKIVEDPRIDRLLEQNEKILKNQEEILKQLDQVKTWVDWLRRRSS
jgi:hypothetical protein